MPSENYLRELVARALHGYPHWRAVPEQMAAQPVKPKKSAYGLLAKCSTGPTEEEIDENRRDMFSGFGELAS